MKRTFLSKIADAAASVFELPKDKKTITVEEYRQYRDSMPATQAKPKVSNPYENVVQRWVVVGGKRFYSRSIWEENYARILEFKKKQGMIKDWHHEPATFNFPVEHGVTSYLIDFMVITKEGRTEWHEVKGRMDQKSKTKLNRMKKYHPNVTMVLIDKDRYAALKKQFERILPDWAKR